MAPPLFSDDAEAARAKKRALERATAACRLCLARFTARAWRTWRERDALARKASLTRALVRALLRVATRAHRRQSLGRALRAWLSAAAGNGDGASGGAGLTRALAPPLARDDYRTTAEALEALGVRVVVARPGEGGGDRGGELRDRRLICHPDANGGLSDDDGDDGDASDEEEVVARGGGATARGASRRRGRAPRQYIVAELAADSPLAASLTVGDVVVAASLTGGRWKAWKELDEDDAHADNPDEASNGMSHDDWPP